MGKDKNEARVEELEELAPDELEELDLDDERSREKATGRPESRRNRPVSVVRFPERAGAEAAGPSSSRVGVGLTRRETLTEGLRTELWLVVHGVLFKPGLPSPALRRVWSAPPLGGVADRIPHDVAKILEAWFTLVEPADVHRFLETVHESLEPPVQTRFVTMVNAALDRGLSDYRFVLRRLIPISSRSDIAAIERSLSACKAAHWVEVEAYLLDGIAHLAEKPEPGAHGAIVAATRAVQLAAAVLTKEHHVDLEDALQDLEAAGHIEKTLRAAYSGLLVYVDSNRRTTSEDARLILVMCASFVSHLTSRLA